jgi:transglutaminase-like putative cysteine protease
MIRRLRVISQDTVFWVVVPLLLILLPHFQRLPLWMSATVVALFIWRLLAIVKPALMPPKWLLLIIVLCTAIPALFSYGTLFGKTAGTAILAILLGIKLLESRQRRDYMLLIALSFFVIVTNFLFSQTIPTVIYMLLTVLVLVMSLIYLNQDQAPLPLKQRFRLASKLLLQALPLMLVLFVLFPRIPGPLWKLPDDAKGARTGLSDTMTPGEISNLVESNAVAFRVEFNDRVPARNQLYWRGLVLWYFDGRSWERGKRNINPWPTMEGFGPPVNYTLTLEPHDRRWLFALDMPAAAPANARYNNNFELRATSKVNSLQQYPLQSYLDYRIQQKLSVWEHSAGLKLPANSNPRTIALGRQWRRQLTSPEAIIQQALTRFNRQQYIYTLRPPLTPGFDPVDRFLFDTRKGFCEHYASAFTLLMRAAGIPARVVVGYQGGTLNPVNSYLTVRQSDAHAWSEVWLENRGWVRIDPTAAIAPERVERSLEAALDEDDFRPLYMRMDVGLWRNLGFYWDAVDNRWKQWVIGYNTERQQRLLSTWLNRQLQYGDIILLLTATTGLVILIISLFIFRPAPGQPRDPYQQLYDRFCRKLARGGLPRPPHQGPQAYADEAMSRFPRQRDLIRLITGLYINARFRSRESRQQLRHMRELVGRLKLSPRA